MAYTSLQYGSKGDSVKELQTKLNGAGYNSGATDGIYGEKTEAALKSYQKANGLSETGALDESTYNKLYGTGTSAGTVTETGTGSDAGATYTGLSGVSSATGENLAKYQNGYQQSQQVTDAQDYLNSVQSKQPGEFNSQYEQQLNDIYDKIANRKEFSYDVNGDALYQQYKDLYTQQGRQAMMDTMGQASALTGGYGSSYASTAGNQAYQQYLTKLSEQVPELANQAYNRYVQEGTDLTNQYGLASDRYEDEYNKYRDQVSDWQTERNYANTDYYNKYSQDYGKYTDEQAYWQNQAQGENEDYWQKQSSAYSTAMTMLQNGTMPSSELLAAAGISQADAKTIKGSYAKSSSSGSGRSGSSKSGSGSTSSASGGASSSFQAATGSTRFSGTGSEFTAAEQKNFDYQVGMSRTSSGRTALIEDAYNEGKISEDTAKKYISKYNLG